MRGFSKFKCYHFQFFIAIFSFCGGHENAPNGYTKTPTDLEDMNGFSSRHLVSCHHLAHDGFLAGSTDAFSDGLDAQSVEVRLQAPKHVVQLVGWFGRSGRRGLPLGLDLLEDTEDRENKRLTDFR